MPTWTKEQNEAIVKSDSNIIVSAGAGSGKTAVLSERVINKLENNIHVNELLILTFTRAAADEMKNRIRKKIEKDPKYKEELNLLNSSYITTFDSFALSVVKKYHYILNISDDIEVADESIVTLEKKKILDRIFNELYESKEESFLKLVDKYCIKNDHNLRNIVYKISDKINEKIDRESYYNYIENEFYQEENINEIIKEYKNYINDKKELIRLELKNLEYYFDSTYTTKVYESLVNILNANVYELSLYTKVSIPQVPRGSSDEAKEIKNNLKKSVDDLIECGNFINEEAIKNNILSTKEEILTISKISKIYLKEINKYKKNNKIYTFSDISFLAIKIVKENENIRKELMSTFKEIMIDEYQDTNDVQETFISLISNNNVYMVGDIKQSIYRFRGSNPNIFKDKYVKYSQNNGGYKIDLIKNFRSRSEVLNSINLIFDIIMDNDLGGADYKETHEMVYGNNLYDNEKLNDYDYNFNVLLYQNNSKESGYSDSEIEIFTIANDIKNKVNSNFKVFDKETNKLRNVTYNDFVIILDRSKYFEDYKKIFEYLNIPLAILRDGNLNGSNELYLIKNIVDLIIRINNKDYGKEFKYDFISIARSFLYEYSDSEIFEIFKNNKFYESSIYKDFSNINNINIKTSTEILLEILSITDFYNKINKIGDYENINVRLNTINDITINLSNLGYTIYEFRDYLDEIIKEDLNIKYTMYSENSESVKILTIHKSKGLEYPICYFADLNHEFNLSDIKDKIILDNKYGLIISELDTKNNSIIKTLFKYQFMKEEISEKIRLFYVALTRAREKIIIVLPDKETKKLEKNDSGVIDKLRRMTFNKLSDLMYAIKDYLGKYYSVIDINKLNLTKDYLYNKNLNNNNLLISKNDIDIEEISIKKTLVEEKHFSKEIPQIINKEIKTNMNYGTKIHEILELIDFDNIDLIEDEFIKRKVKKFISNDLFKNIKESRIYKEYEFIYEENNIKYHGIIDLILEYENYIDIVDYKLKNILDSNYINQLNGYKKYIEKLTNKKVNLYLYSILEEKIEEL